MADLTGVIRFIGTVIVLLSSGVVGYYPGGIEEAIEQIEAVPPDIDASSYLLPAKLSHKYMPYAPPQPQSSDGIWKHVPNPNLYVLTERDTDSSDDKSDTKSKRSGRNGLGGLSGNGPSLSIVNPLEVLRQRLLLEIARRRMRQSEDQIQANRELLKTIGKRSFGSSSSSSSSSRLSPGGSSDDSLPLSISSRSHSSADSNSNSLSHRFDQEAEMDSGADHRSKRSVPELQSGAEPRDSRLGNGMQTVDEKDSDRWSRHHASNIKNH